MNSLGIFETGASSSYMVLGLKCFALVGLVLATVESASWEDHKVSDWKLVEHKITLIKCWMIELEKTLKTNL